jgi:hypothetical protein
LKETRLSDEIGQRNTKIKLKMTQTDHINCKPEQIRRGEEAGK